MRVTAWVLLSTTLIAGQTACRGTPTAFGPTHAEARRNAEDLFGAFATRFTNVTRTPKFEHGRGRLARYALSPSGVYNDTAVWTGSSGDTRTLTLLGSHKGLGYLFDASPIVAHPTRPGDSRHFIHLTKLPEHDVFRWDTGVEMAVGDVRPRMIRDVWGSLLATAGQPEALLRAEYRTAFPRTTRMLGQLFSLDSIATRPLGDGSHAITLVTTIHDDRVKAAGYPAFAKYLDKYVKPARYSLVVTDQSGARWMEATAREYTLVFRLRAANGRLAPLEGPVRTIPDQLRITGNYYAKFSIFTIGMERLVTNLAIVNRPGAVGWDMHFRTQPKWKFPLFTNQFIKSSLRRPFMGDGIQMRILFTRAGEDSPTRMDRYTRVDVQESAIVRWLGGLGSDAMGEFAGQVEQEENRFLAAVFRALAEDAAAAAGGAADGSSNARSDP